MTTTKNFETYTNDLKQQLVDYNTFKKYVMIHSKLEQFAIAAFGFSIVILFINALYSIFILFENQLPLRFFMQVFLDDTGTNMIWFLLTIGALILLIPATIAFIFHLLTKKQRFEKVYNQYVENRTITSEEFVLLDGRYYINFRNVSNLDKMKQLLADGTLDNDKKFNRMIRTNNIEKQKQAISKYLIKKYDFDSYIDKVIRIRDKNVLTCSDGIFCLYVQDKHRIRNIENPVTL